MLLIIYGPEFGKDEGRQTLDKRALYGNKAADCDFRNHLRYCMENLGYSTCLADPDPWMGKAYKSETGEPDGALCVSKNPVAQLEELNKYFKLKPGSIHPPKIYLGSKLSKCVLPNESKV